jgi:ASPM-SPD-2-Hydin domain-containing protein
LLSRFSARNHEVRIVARTLQALLVIAGLAVLVGCQGLSSGNQSSSVTVTGGLQANPTSVNFGYVKVGSQQTNSVSLTNTGTSSIVISQISSSSGLFSVGALNLPATVAGGQSITLGATFSPSSATSSSGNLTISSNAANASLSVAVSGIGSSTAPPPQAQLSVSPSSFGFGSVTVGSTLSKSGSLIASGASVTISSAPSVSAPYSLSGITFPITIPAGQSAPFTLTFKPTVSGPASENISFASNATNSPAVQAESGTGTTTQKQNPISQGMFILNPPTNDGECSSPYPSNCYSGHLVPTLICTGNNAPSGYGCTQAGTGEPYIKGAIFSINWTAINPSNGTFDFSVADGRMQDWQAAGKLVSFVFLPTGFGSSNNATPSWYMTPVPISSVSQTSGIIQVQTSAPIGFLPGSLNQAAGLEIQITNTGTGLDSTSTNPGIYTICDHNTAGCQDPSSQTIYAIGSGADIAAVQNIGAVGNPVYGSANGSVCTSGVLPIEWRPNFIQAWQSVIAQAIAHYGSNSSVAYMRFGMGIGGQSEPTNGLSSFDPNPTACEAQMTEFGFTTTPAPWPSPGTSGWSQVSANWIAYLQNMLQFEQSQNSPKALIMTLSPIIYAPEDLGTIDTTAANAAAAGVGIGNQGLEKNDPINYAEGKPCYGGDWCANFPKYQGQVSTQQQTLSDSDPTNQTQMGSLAPSLLTFATNHGTGILELYFDDWMCTFDTAWSGENTYAACNSAGYPAVLAAAAAQIN